jgi:hypothetical protein
MAISKTHSDEVKFPGRDDIRRAAGWIEARYPGPAWAAVPTWVGGVSLVVAVTGLFWDVAFHIDHGRDLRNLFTVPHLLILFGLLGLGASAALSILLATAEGAATALRAGPLRVPAGGLAMLVMATGAAIGFPLDNLWHEVYGIDVTLWSPTHLLMVGGAVFATLALNLLVAEGRAASGARVPRWQLVALAGSVLIGLSGFGLEFDYGAPQWQALYQPLLIAIAAGFGLCLARAAIGRGGALLATAFYLGLRLILLAMVWRLGYTVPAMPLLLGCALCVEAAFLLENRRPALVVALFAGVLVATVGMATEWVSNHLLYPLPWQQSMLSRFWVPALAALAAAVIGTALGRIVGGHRAGIRPGAVMIGLAVLALLLAFPFPRGGGPIPATLTAAPVGPQRAAVDRYGQPSYEQDENVTVQLADPGAVRGADWFTILAWQGGGRRLIRLQAEGAGRWRSAEPVPTGGAWKSVVYLASGPTMLAAPIYFPPDPTYGSPGYQAGPVMKRSFEPSPELITSESHGGAPWVALAAYLALAVLAAGWLLSLALAARRVSALAPVPARALGGAPLRRRPLVT